MDLWYSYFGERLSGLEEVEVEAEEEEDAEECDIEDSLDSETAGPKLSQGNLI